MAFLRILHDNALKRSSSLSASSTAGAGFYVSNLLNDKKSYIWRSDAGDVSENITIEWASAEYINCVVLPFTNFSSSAEMRVRLYTNTSDTNPVYNSGYVSVLADLIDNVEWGTGVIGANAFSFGGGAYAVIWIPQAYPVKKVSITINDSLNTQGYLEVGALSLGKYWSPERGCEYGCSVENVDTSTQDRSDAGDLITDRSTSHKKMSVDVTYMPSTDKTKMWQTIRNVGKHTPLFVSLVPESDEPTDEQVYQIYGKFSSDIGIQFKFLDQFDSSLDIEEI